jgi:hypothetical protein
MVGHQLFLVHADGCNHMILGRLVEEDADGWATEVVDKGGYMEAVLFDTSNSALNKRYQPILLEVSLRATLTKSQ